MTLQCEPAVPAARGRGAEALVATSSPSGTAIVATNEHVDCYWFPHTDVCTVKASNRTDEPIRTRTGYKKWRNEIWYGNFMFGSQAASAGCVPR